MADEVHGLNKLLDFDKARQLYWKKSAQAQFKQLNTLKTSDFLNIQKQNDETNELTQQVVKMNIRLQIERRNTLRKIHSITSDIEGLSKVLMGDVKLDRFRVTELKNEQKAVMKDQDAQMYKMKEEVQKSS